MFHRIRALALACGLGSAAAAAAQVLPATTPVAESPAAGTAAHPSAEADGPAPDGGPAPESHGSSDFLFLPKPGETEENRLGASWDHGLWFESADKKFRVHVGGNAQIDSTWLIGPQSLFALPNGGTNGVDNASATFLRRVRLRADGSIYDQFDYVVEYDFANAGNENDGLQPPSFGNLTGEPNPCNVWMQVRDVPWVGDVRVGNVVKPIGLSNNTSQTNLPFLERADNMDAFWGAFDGGFALGATARGRTESERVTWQYGVYRPAINVFGVALNKAAYGGRVTALPVYEDDGERLVHVGFGTFDGELVQNDLRLRARPLLRNGPGYAVPVLVDTGLVPGSRQYTLAPEFAAVYGSWTVQAEWAGQFLTDATPNGQPVGTAFFHGGYVEVLYFLTGEHQDYDRRDGAFGRVAPRNNYHVKTCDSCRTLGAWQVGVRFSYLDLNDDAIRGGQVYDWTVGLNWFLNPNMKVQFNYVAEHRDSPQDAIKGWINGVGVRAAYDF